MFVCRTTWTRWGFGRDMLSEIIRGISFGWGERSRAGTQGSEVRKKGRGERMVVMVISGVVR